MNVILYLLPLALGLGLFGLLTFLWALRTGQYNDLEGAALRVLSDDDVGGDQASSMTVSKSAGRTISSNSQSSE